MSKHVISSIESADFFPNVMWRYTENKQSKGPVSTEEIVKLYQSGQLENKCKVWNGRDVKEWTSVGKVPAICNQMSIRNSEQGARESQNPFEDLQDPFGGFDLLSDALEEKEPKPRVSKLVAPSSQPSSQPTSRRTRDRMSISDFGDHLQARSAKIQKSGGDFKSNNGVPGVGLGKHSGVIEIINNLRAVGAQMEVDLPSIALCGSQSCGKSSLTEAICGVAMPRNAGTCTRCPTELRLIQKEGSFKCDVGIRFEYDVDMKPMNVVHEKHIGSVSNREGVATLVSRAQKKILDASSLQFSRNVITVSIYDPECLNLTILDLPGLIFAMSNKEDNKYIKLVKDLVLDTIKKPNTLIAAVISCKDDMENQLINRLAREQDPTGSRTIGILTKVDCIEPGTESDWIDVLQNKKFPLKLGYVAVKNPNQQQLAQNLNYAQTRELERQYFTKEPWSTLPAEIQSRYGAKSLSSILSDTLGALIVKQLPRMKAVIETKLSAVRAELKALPAPPRSEDESVAEHAFGVLTNYCDTMKNLVRLKDSDFWEDAMVELRAFQGKLEYVKPRFTSKGLVSETISSIKNRYNEKIVYTMADVMKEKKKNRRQVASCGRKYFVQKSMNRWETITREIVTECSSTLMNHIKKASHTNLRPYRRLCAASVGVMVNLVEELTEETMEHVMFMLQREIKSEFTLSVKRRHLSYSHALDQLCEGMGVEKKNENQFEENEAVMIMANAIAYYDLSFRRHADVTAMAIESMLFTKFAEKCTTILLRTLGLFNASEEQLKKLMVEDEGVANQRKEIMVRLERLEKTAKELRCTVQEDWEDEVNFKGLDLTAEARPSESVSEAKRNSSRSPSKKKKKKKKFGFLFN